MDVTPETCRVNTELPLTSVPDQDEASTAGDGEVILETNRGAASEWSDRDVSAGCRDKDEGTVPVGDSTDCT